MDGLEVSLAVPTVAKDLGYDYQIKSINRYSEV